MYKRLLVAMVLLWVGRPLYAQSPTLVVAWAANGQLYLWQSGDAEPTVVAANGAQQPFLSPDGNTIAYTTGADGLPGSLWVVGANGEPRQVVSSALVDEALIDQIAWADAATLYFNTSEFAPPLGVNPRDDLYHIDITSDSVAVVLPPGDGGAFSVSPSGERLVLVRAGGFDESGSVANDGDIRMLDSVDGTVDQLHTFAPATTGSHNGYYPWVAWADGDTLLTAIPPMLFNLSGSKVVDTPLWQMSSTGNTLQMGAVPVDYGYSLGWSHNGNNLYYIQTGDVRQLILAETNGEGAEVISVDTFTGFVWAEVGRQYAFVRDGNNIVYGTPGQDAITIITDADGTLGDLNLLNERTLVYIMFADEQFSLHVASINGGQVETTRLATADRVNGIAYDAVMR